MRIARVALFVVLIITLASFGLYAEEAKRTSKITSIDGQAQVKKMGDTKWIPAKSGMILNEGDIIKTASSATMVINVDGYGETASVEVKPGSEVTLSELKKDEAKGTQKTLLDLAMGEVLIKAQKLNSPDSKFEVKTPTSVVGVRGTTFSVAVESME